MKLLTRYITIIFLLISQFSSAQSFITKVSATTIGKNDVLQIEYEADNVAMEQFVLPRFDNWTVVSGPNLSSSTIQQGNVVKQQLVYSVIVQPNATGTLTIPGATAMIDNKPQRSNSVSVKVKDVSHITGSQPPAQAPASSLFDRFPSQDEVPSTQYLKKGEKAIDKIRNNIMVRLEVDKLHCYVGEPILATYKLCTRLRSKSKVVKQPQFTGCTVVELTGEDQDQHVEKINGIEYNVFVIRKVQLVPLDAGKLVLPQASVENKVSFYNAGNLSYRDLYYTPPSIPVEEQLVTLQNKAETIEVKALPPVPSVGNSDFSGAIGSFDASIAIQENKVSTSNTSHLLYVIEGAGNIQQVRSPAIKWPKGIEAFETTEQTEEYKSSFPVKYKKTFSFPFIASKKGRYIFPPVEFTYFDPADNKYKTKATRPFTLSVSQGHKNFLHAYTNQDDSVGFKKRLYLLLGGALVTVLIGLIWFNGKQQLSVQTVSTPAVPSPEEKQDEYINRDTSAFLFAIRELQPDSDSSIFYKQLRKNVGDYISTKFGIKVNDLPLYIERNPALASSLKQLKDLIDNCSLGMYTPVFTIEQAMQHRLEAIEVLNNLENKSEQIE